MARPPWINLYFNIWGPAKDMTAAKRSFIGAGENIKKNNIKHFANIIDILKQSAIMSIGS